MADVLLVERRRVEVLLRVVRFLVVPVGLELHAVRIRVDEHDDDIVQDPIGFGVRAGDHLIAGFNQLVGAEHFARMKATIDPDHRLPFLGELLRGGLIDLGVGELFHHVAVLRELFDVRGTRHDHRELRPALGGEPDGIELRPLRFPGDLLPIAGELRVVRQPVVVADVVAEELLRCGDLLGCHIRRRQTERDERERADSQERLKPAEERNSTHDGVTPIVFRAAASRTRHGGARAQRLTLEPTAPRRHPLIDPTASRYP